MARSAAPDVNASMQPHQRACECSHPSTRVLCTYILLPLAVGFLQKLKKSMTLTHTVSAYALTSIDKLQRFGFADQHLQWRTLLRSISKWLQVT